jgi:hypothetical protein
VDNSATPVPFSRTIGNFSNQKNVGGGNVEILRIAEPAIGICKPCAGVEWKSTESRYFDS